MEIEGFFAFNDESIDILPLGDKLEVIKFTSGYVRFPLRILPSERRFFVSLRLQGKIIERSLPEFTGDDLSFYDPAFLAHEGKLDNLGIGIWFDEQTKTLKLYREMFGQIPLYYVFVPGKYIAFSTRLTTLLKLPRVMPSLTINLNTVVQFSTFAEDSFQHYSEATFYNEVKAALPGHLTTLTTSEVSVQQSFNFEAVKEDKFVFLEEYGEAFYALFKNSVYSNLKNNSGPIASHLSGGLDSSSISALAKEIFPNHTLHTLYADTKAKASDEQYYSKLVAKRIGSVHHEVHPSSGHLEMLQLYTSLYGHPERMLLGSSFQGSLMAYAKNLGATSLLIGHPGDTIVGTGFEILSDAFESKDYKNLNILLRQRAVNSNHASVFEGYESFSSEKKSELFSSNFLFRELPKLYKKLPFNDFLSLINDLHRDTDFSLRYALSRLGNAAKRRVAKQRKKVMTLLRDEPWHHESIRPYSPFTQNRKWADGVYTTQAIGFNEIIYTLGNYYNIENRFPFYDKDLYAFSLQVPSIIKFDAGRGRGHLRQAMKGVLPQEVIDRTNKAKFGIYGNEVTLELVMQSRDFLNSANEVWNYLDYDKFHVALKVIKDYPGENSPNSLLIIRAVALSVWLDLFRRKAFI